MTANMAETENKCKRCAGTGAVGLGGDIPCPDCHGTGQTPGRVTTDED